MCRRSGCKQQPAKDILEDRQHSYWSGECCAPLLVECRTKYVAAEDTYSTQKKATTDFGCCRWLASDDVVSKSC